MMPSIWNVPAKKHQERSHIHYRVHVQAPQVLHDINQRMQNIDMRAKLARIVQLSSPLFEVGVESEKAGE